MRVFKGHRLVGEAPKHAVVAIGNFDGVHLGHVAIVREAIARARARSGTAVVYTFRPHPQLVLDAEKAREQPLLSAVLPTPLLTTYDEKLNCLGALGVDWVVEEPFNEEFAGTSPDHYFEEIVHRRLGAEAVVVGYDFGFGKGRAAGIDALRGFCEAAGVELTVVPPFQGEGGEVISSTRIRRALIEGELETANRLLGREFSYQGKVEHGESRGRKLGFPTANLRPGKLVLPFGVYATWATFQGKRVASVTNLGVRPTFPREDGAEPPILIETHLIGQKKVDLYGRHLEVAFVKQLRSEKKFESIDALSAQIACDLGDAELVLSAK